VSYWIHPDAEAELGDAAVYYAEHANLAIAQAFIAEFERVLDLLVANPQRGPHGDFGFRVYHFDRFPYTVVYEDNPSLGPQVYAVAHQHREPGYWHQRTEPGGAC
jgi:toxin ParE1/3/4